MIDEKQAIAIFKKKNPKLKINTACKYYDKRTKKKYYVVMATEKDNEVDYNDPFYAIDSANGKILSFSPVLDQDAYIRALKQNPIPIN